MPPGLLAGVDESLPARRVGVDRPDGVYDVPGRQVSPRGGDRRAYPSARLSSCCTPPLPLAALSL